MALWLEYKLVFYYSGLYLPCKLDANFEYENRTDFYRILDI